MVLTVPPPRSSPDAGPGPAALARWYERKLGWATEGRAPVRLLTGLRFDVLELPAEAGHALLRRPVRTGPVLLSGGRMGLLVAAGGADELPGLLDWLEWGPIALDLTAVGAGAGSRLRHPGVRARRGPPCGCGPRAEAYARAGASRSRGLREQRWGCPRSRTPGGRRGDGMPSGPVVACPGRAA
ncbi:hypothetical protein Smic_34010 [Streptomyces microflavus]|uniref:Proline-rich protein n=1 Tax=Streptomyces microflavus TaxID=1919 RepID=A0A7J0CT42_STRMI|nr:hypothetical protein Smic_34010 [Streptomyces microflavus]